MVAAFDYCLHGKGGAAPSIDTAMHGLVDAAHVDHLHPDSGIALATAADGEKLTEQCFGDRVVWVPWRRPGFQLGLDIAAIKRGQPAGHRGASWAGTASPPGATPASRPRRTRWRSSAPRRRSWTSTAAPSRSAPVVPGNEPLPEAERHAKAAAIFPTIRGLASTDRPQVGHYTDSDVVLEFLAREKLAPLAELGTSCPDHFLRTKVKPLVVDLPGTADRRGDHRPAGRAARGLPGRLPGLLRPQRHRRTPRAIRGADPAIVLVPGVGMFSFGKDKQTARVAGEFYVNAINVMRGAESVSTYAPISEAEKFRIEYWALEEAKLARMPKPKPLATRVALVTGGGSGIGKAIATRIAAEGGCVVVADLDLAKAAGGGRRARRRRTSRSPCGPTCPTRPPSPRRWPPGVLAFGGVDLVVNNAGLSLSKPLLETTVRGLGPAARRDGQGLVPGLPGGRPGDDRAEAGRRHRLHLQQELDLRRAEQHRLLRDQGRPGPPGPAAGRRARPARRPGQRHQPRRRGPRLRASSPAAGAPTGPRSTGSRRRSSAPTTPSAPCSAGRCCPSTSPTRCSRSPAATCPRPPACTSRSTPASPPRSCDDRRSTLAAVDLGASSGRVMLGRVGPDRWS